MQLNRNLSLSLHGRLLITLALVAGLALWLRPLSMRSATSAALKPSSFSAKTRGFSTRTQPWLNALAERSKSERAGVSWK